MFASHDELDEMRAALDSALGQRRPQDAPDPDRDWRRSWPSLCEMGLTSFTLPEVQGGFGLEVSAALVASRALGGALHGSPYPAIAASACALSRGLSEPDRSALGADIAAGRCVPALALLEASAEIEGEAGSARVRGTARLVAGAGDCDAFLVISKASGRMAFVPGRDSVSVTREHAFDVTRSVADVHFDSAPALELAGSAVDPGAVERIFGLLLAGDAIGGARRMLERTRLYTLEREAFGRPIGGFQAVQHRLVDHELRLRALSLLATDAADKIRRGDDGASRAALLAEVAVGTDVLPLLHDLVQLNGGIAFTWEHGLHFYERRAQLDARLARNPRAARQALARFEGWSSTG